MLLLSATVFQAVADSELRGSTFFLGENVGWIAEASEPYAVKVHFNGERGWLTGYL